MLSYAKASERCCGNLRQGFEGTILFFVKAWRRVTVEVSAEARVASAKRAILFFAEASKSEGGAGGDRTLVLTMSLQAFYMFSL